MTGGTDNIAQKTPNKRTPRDNRQWRKGFEKFARRPWQRLAQCRDSDRRFRREEFVQQSICNAP